MSSNSIAISRELLAAGVEQATANAVAEAIVKHSDDRNATKVEILELKDSLKDEINALRNQLLKLDAKVDAMGERMDAEAKKNDMRFNFVMGLLVVLVAGVFVPLLQNLFGG